MTSKLSRRGFLAGTSAFVASALLAVACTPLNRPAAGDAGPRSRKSMTFMAGYKPQANVSFVGVYVANDLGFFQEQQLEVTIQHSSGQGEHAKLLAARKIEVITDPATSLIKHVTEEEIPFISLAVLTQKGDSAMASLKASGIDSPRKFEGKTVGYKVFPVFEYLAMLKAANVDRSKIHEVSVGFDVRVLTEGKVDVLPVFRSNEPDLLRRLGFEVNLIDPVDYGVQTLGQLWITHRELLAADPDLFARFLKAALNGLAYAFDHPGEAIDVVMRYAPHEDRAHQEYMLNVEKQSSITELTRQNGLGWQTLEQWTTLQDGLAEFGLIKKKADPRLFFAADLPRKLYQNGKLIWP